MGHKIKTFIIILCFAFLSFCNTIYADTVTDAIKAVAKNDYTTIKKMLDNGLDPNLKGKGSAQAGLLNTACNRGRVKIVQLLLSRGADVNLAGNQGRTPMMGAARNAKTLDILKILIKKGANIQAVDDHGVSVFDNAVIGVVSRQTSMESLKFLVNQGLNVNKSTLKGKTTGYTALMMAARSNHIELAKYLISKGANVNANAEQGDTPLSIAMEEKHKKMMALLKKHGATTVIKEKSKHKVYRISLLKGNVGIIKHRHSSVTFHRKDGGGGTFFYKLVLMLRWFRYIFPICNLFFSGKISPRPQLTMRSFIIYRHLPLYR